MGPGSIPIVRLTLESMQHSILMAFSEHAASMDADVQAAVKEVCTPERVAEMIAAATEREIKGAIDQEIRNYYSYGNGRAVIKNAVVKHLDAKPESREY